MRATRPGIVLALLTLAIPASALAAEETLEAHKNEPQTVIVLDDERVQPSESTMERNNVLVFENHTTHFVTVRFVEPADAAEKVHCHFVHRKASAKPEEPWLIFGLQGGKLAANVPPGKFASLCAIDPGKYAFVAEPQRVKTDRAAAANGGVLSQKGQITVN